MMMGMPGRHHYGQWGSSDNVVRRWLDRSEACTRKAGTASASLRPFDSQDSAWLTRTLEVKRGKVNEHFDDLIVDMHAE